MIYTFMGDGRICQRCERANRVFHSKTAVFCNSCRTTLWRKQQDPEIRRAIDRANYKALSKHFCDKAKRRHKEIKLETFDAYGGRFCMWCGEADCDALTLDHIKNDGKSHRKSAGGSRAIYNQLKRDGYPKGIVQVLCANCNQAKALNGGILPESRRRPTPDEWFSRAGCLGI